MKHVSVENANVQLAANGQHLEEGNRSRKGATLMRHHPNKCGSTEAHTASICGTNV